MVTLVSRKGWLRNLRNIKGHERGASIEDAGEYNTMYH